MLPHRDTESGETLPVAEKVSRFRGSGTIDGTGQVASIVMPRRCRRALNATLGRFFASLMPCSNLRIQKKNTTQQGSVLFVITQHYRFFISADYLLPDMELQQKEQLQTQDQHEHADHQKRYVHQKQKAHPAYLLPQGKTPHQYGHSIFAGF